MRQRETRRATASPRTPATCCADGRVGSRFGSIARRTGAALRGGPRAEAIGGHPHHPVQRGRQAAQQTRRPLRRARWAQNRQKTPRRELEIARKRMKEVKHANA